MFMKLIDVSVIMPVYNTADYLAESISTIVRQTLRNIEILIIDDGSTDNSLEVMRQFQKHDSRIRVFSQENKGVSAARNLGISNSLGKYIYFMDSDDLLDERALAECFYKSEEEDLDLLFFDADVFGADSSRRFNYKRTHLLVGDICSGRKTLERLFEIEGFHVSPCLNFIKNSYLKRTELLFHPGIIHEDELFTLELFLYAERVSFINQCYFKRRVRADSIMTSKFSRNNIIGYFTVISRIEEIKDKPSSDNETIELVDRRLGAVVPAVLYESRRSSLRNRLYVLFNSCRKFRRYVSCKDILGLAFPFLSKFRG